MDMWRHGKICRNTERRNTMRNKNPRNTMSIVARIMTALGLLGAVAATVLRVWVFPAQQDMDTGLFVSNTTVIVMMLAIVGALAALTFVTRGGPRQEITGKPSLLLSVVLLAVGAALSVTGIADIFTALGEKPLVETAAWSLVMGWAQRLFCLLGGVALVRLGLLLASESATRRGIAQWSVLAPVLWMWFVLANYEMSYASMVRLSDGFFTLGTYIFELLFLFYFARYMAGVGKVGAGTLLLFSCGATLFAISTPVTKMLMYLLQDVEAYAVGTTGVLDLAVGVLALVVSITLCQSLSAPSAEVAEEETEEAPVAEESEAELIEGFEDSNEE